MAATVASAKALIELNTSDPRARDAVSTEDARKMVIGKIEAIAERQADALAHHGLCPMEPSVLAQVRNRNGTMSPGTSV